MATRFFIEGHVQGVGYRRWCQREAEARGLSGYVRNLSDGRVEAVFICKSEIIDEMLARCRVGPSLSHVSAVGLDAIDAPNIDGFVILKDN